MKKVKTYMDTLMTDKKFREKFHDEYLHLFKKYKTIREKNYLPKIENMKAIS